MYDRLSWSLLFFYECKHSIQYVHTLFIFSCTNDRQLKHVFKILVSSVIIILIFSCYQDTLRRPFQIRTDLHLTNIPLPTAKEVLTNQLDCKLYY